MSRYLTRMVASAQHPGGSFHPIAASAYGSAPQRSEQRRDPHPATDLRVVAQSATMPAPQNFEPDNGRSEPTLHGRPKEAKTDPVREDSQPNVASDPTLDRATERSKHTHQDGSSWPLVEGHRALSGASRTERKTDRGPQRRDDRNDSRSTAGETESTRQPPDEESDLMGEPALGGVHRSVSSPKPPTVKLVPEGRGQEPYTQHIGGSPTESSWSAATAHAVSTKPFQPLLPEMTPAQQAMEVSSASKVVPMNAPFSPSTNGATKNTLATGSEPRREQSRESRRQRELQPREPDEIHVHIGRIEVTAMQPAPMPAQPAPMRKTPSLDDYLRRGNGRA